MNGAGLRPEKKPRAAMAPAGGAPRRRSARRAPWRAAILPRLLVFLALPGAAIVLASCGASIQAVYEGDVRFEHCMALDAQPDVKPAIRRACWREWISFYTYGQTRDRVRHAQRRIHELSGVSEFVAGTGPNGAGNEPLEAPEPSSALQSPPAAVSAGSDGGAAPPAPASATAAVASPRDQCLEECEAEGEDCVSDCRTHACEKSCAITRRSCVRRCPREGGGHLRSGG